jgi:hypothetical protein
MRGCGFAMATLQYAYDQWRQLGQDPPAFDPRYEVLERVARDVLPLVSTP